MFEERNSAGIRLAWGVGYILYGLLFPFLSSFPDAGMPMPAEAVDYQ